MTTLTCDYSPPPAGPDTVYPHNNPIAPIGNVGAHFRYHTSDWTLHNLSLDESMRAPLDSFVDNLSWFSSEFGDAGYGNILWIGEIGGPPNTQRTTFHSVGKALDVTWIQWAGGNTSKPRYAESEVFDAQGNWRPTTHRRLVAVEAGLRKWFGYVLNRYVGNPSLDVSTWSAEGPRSKHHNHFHVDNECHVALRLDSDESTQRDDNGEHAERPIRSCHYFLQDCINAFTDEKVDYDGIWDADTGRAYLHLLSDLGMECIDPVRYVNHYMIFLDFVMMHGFADARAGTFRWGDNTIL